MAVALLVAYLLIPIILGVRLCFVLRECSDFVRHPSQRSLPVNPWTMFAKRLSLRCRLPLGILLALALLTSCSPAWRTDVHWGEWVFAAVLASFPLTQALLVFLLGFLMLGRIHNPAMLAVFAVGSSFVGIIVLALMTNLLPKALTYITFDNPNGLTGFTLGPAWMLVGTVACAAATMWWARRAGAPAWLGFED